MEDAHPTAGEDAHPDAHPSAAQPDQPASQPESQPVDEPSDDEMDQAWYVSLLSGPISLVPSRSAVFDPCAELKSNDRPKALYVFPEAQFFVGFISIGVLALPSYEPGTDITTPTKRRSPFVP